MSSAVIPAKERCIVALDVPSYNDAMRLVDALDGVAAFYKIGLELFAAGDGMRLLSNLVKRKLKVFADLKLFDVPETVGRATARIADSGAHFLTVHGNDTIMRAAVQNKGDKLKILAVTALTSLDNGDLSDLGFSCDIQSLVLSRARRALVLGCDGVVSSGLEVAPLRADNGNKLILVTPGVRPLQNADDDQKRTATPSDIIRAGGDYLVVGRPIKNAANPREALQNIITEIKNADSA